MLATYKHIASYNLVGKVNMLPEDFYVGGGSQIPEAWSDA